MWFIYFVNGLNNNFTTNLSPYITSGFEGHSLLSVISVVTSVMGASCLLPIAKVLNLWDRTLGMCIMILIAMMGLIMMAACNNIATYCAAQVSTPRLPVQPADSIQTLTFPLFFKVILYCWPHGCYFLRRCYDFRYLHPSKSRNCIRFHLVPLYHNGILRTILVQPVS